MKTMLLLITAGVFLLGGTAWAYHCPVSMKKIDAALSGDAATKLSAEQLAEVKKRRAEGEAMHNSGDHGGSVKTLDAALAILGIN